MVKLEEERTKNNMSCRSGSWWGCTRCGEVRRADNTVDVVKLEGVLGVVKLEERITQ